MPMPGDSASGNRTGLFDDIRLVGEPRLGWTRAVAVWGPAWHTYIYVSLAVEVVLLVWAVVNIAFIYRRRVLASRPYFLTLNVMVIVFCLFRIVFLTMDPHSTRDIAPRIINNLLFNVSFPTLTVGYFLTYVALKQCTLLDGQVSALPIVLKTRFIVIFVFGCFFISTLTDVLVFYVHSSGLMMILCQLFYIAWGLVFFGLFVNLIRLFRKKVRLTKSKMERSCYRVGHCRRDFGRFNMRRLPLYVRISCAASVFTMLLVVSNVVRVILEVGLMRRSALTSLCEQYRQVWPFFSFLCIEMIIEHLLALSLTICGTQPLEKLRVCRLASSTLITTANSLPTADLSSVSASVSATSTTNSPPTNELSIISSATSTTAAPAVVSSAVDDAAPVTATDCSISCENSTIPTVLEAYGQSRTTQERF